MRQIEIDLIVECRGCGSVTYSGEKNVTLKPGDQIIFLNKLRKRSCPSCEGPRTPKYPGKPGTYHR